MNRAQRRAAERAKPQEYRTVPLPKMLDEFTVFNDLERMLEKIEHGEIEHANGKPIMMASNGEWYEVVPALNGWISAWKMFDQKFQLHHDLSALVRLANCLDHGVLIQIGLLKSAKAVIAEQRRLFRLIPRDQIASAARTKQIALMMGAE